MKLLISQCFLLLAAARRGAGKNGPEAWLWRGLFRGQLRASAHLSDSSKSHQDRANGTFGNLRVILRYTACTGLVNQLYCHISAISLARAMEVELVLPPAVKLDAKQSEQNEVKWVSDDLETLLDVDSLIEFWKLKGLRIHKVRLPGLFSHGI